MLRLMSVFLTEYKSFFSFLSAVWADGREEEV